MGRNVGTSLLALSVTSAAADGDYPSPLRRRARENRENLYFEPKANTPEIGPVPNLPWDVDVSDVPGPMPDLPLKEDVPPDHGVGFCDVFLWVSCVTTVSGTYAPCGSIWSLPPTFDGCEADLQVLVFVQNLGGGKMTVVRMTTWLDDEAEVLVSDNPLVEIPVDGSIIRTKTITANVCDGDGGNHALTTVIFGTYLVDGICYDVDQMVWKQ